MMWEDTEIAMHIECMCGPLPSIGYRTLMLLLAPSFDRGWLMLEVPAGLCSIAVVV